MKKTLFFSFLFVFFAVGFIASITPLADAGQGYRETYRQESSASSYEATQRATYTSRPQPAPRSARYERDFCPGCEPSSYVPNVTHWNQLGNGVDLVDANNPDKPRGSCASKIWIPKGEIRLPDGTVVPGGVARVQLVRYNGEPSSRAYHEAIERIRTELAPRLAEHDGKVGQTCLYVLHQP